MVRDVNIRYLNLDSPPTEKVRGDPEIILAAFDSRRISSFVAEFTFALAINTAI